MLRRKLGFSGTTLFLGATGQGCTRCLPPTIQPYIDALANDVDKNGTVGPLLDALLILRCLFGFRGPTLVTGATGNGCAQCTAVQIEVNIASLL